MNEIVDLDRTSDPAHRRERGIEAYARVAGPGSQTSPGNADVRHSSR